MYSIPLQLSLTFSIKNFWVHYRFYSILQAESSTSTVRVQQGCPTSRPQPQNDPLKGLSVAFMMTIKCHDFMKFRHLSGCIGSFD